MDEALLPRWAERARDLFRALFIVYALLWLVRSALWLIDLIFDTSLYFSPRWLDVTIYTMAGVWLVSGLGWLAGSMVAGLKEPKRP